MSCLAFSRKFTTRSAAAFLHSNYHQDRVKISPRDHYEGLHRFDSPEGSTQFRCGIYGLVNKFELAVENDVLNESIGIDVVAMSVNELVTTGAKPWRFLDYMSTKGHGDVFNAYKMIVGGMRIACDQIDCSLYYKKEEDESLGYYVRAGSLLGDYGFRRGFVIAGNDLGGVSVGSVKTNLIIDGKNIVPGDVLIGLPSSGVHSNGYSHVRRVLEQSGASLRDNLPGTTITLGESLMSPTVIYVKQVLDIISNGGVKGIVRIKGGGFTENIPRIIPVGLGATIFNDSWVVPPIFRWIQEAGRIDEVEMRRTFNMGIGMVLVVSEESAHRILGESNGKNIAYRIGKVVSGIGAGVMYQ